MEWVWYTFSAKFARQAVEPLMRYGDFSIFPRWRPSAILDLWWACLGHIRRSFGGLYQCAEFGLNQRAVMIISQVWLENAYSRPEIIFWGFYPLNETPRRHLLMRKVVIWHIERQNRSTGATCARDEKTKKERTRMWANAQRDGRPAVRLLNIGMRPLFNAAKFGWRPLLDAVQ